MIRFFLRACIALACVVVASCVGHQHASHPAEPAPILVLVSIDGWHPSYTDRANALNLRALAARGVRAEALIGAFPTKTFSNHYTMVTGLYPATHGILSNNIWDDEIGTRFTMSADTAKDPRWWGGEPLWVTAIRQGRKASSMFWPGSEVEIRGVRPTAYRPYDEKVTEAERVTQVLAWLALPEPERPSFVTLYFEAVDTAGHDYGPGASETLAVAARIDARVGDLVAGIEKLGLTARTTVMVVSDHGMSALAPDRRIFLDDYVNLASVNVVEWSPVLHIAPRTGSVEELYKTLHGRHPALKVYRRDELPATFHFKNHPRIQPIIALADDGWAITTHERFAKAVQEGRVSKGDHGYDPRLPSMHALFVAAGPGLRAGLVVRPFENVHLYELMCRLLRLKPADNEGDLAATRSFLR